MNGEIPPASPFDLARAGEVGRVLEWLVATPGLAAIRELGGATLLHLAAELGQVDLAAALLRAGADPNALNVDGEPPLMQLSCSRGVELAELLIRNGADPAYVEPSTMFTPLGHAIASQNAPWRST